jgi:hypothetical protein
MSLFKNEKAFETDNERIKYIGDCEFDDRYWKGDEVFDSKPVESNFVESKNTWPPACPKNHTQDGWNIFIKEYERVVLKKEVKK